MTKLLQGVLMIAMNFGTKHVVSELTPWQEQLMATAVAKRIVLFAIFFTATRDFICSLALTGMFTLAMSTLLNERSQFYLFDDERQRTSAE